MDHIILKLRGSKTYYNAVSNKRAYERVDVSDAILYSANTLLEDGQWYFLVDFSKTDFCIELLKEPLDTTAFDTGKIKDVELIEYLIAYQNSKDFCFQRVYKKSWIKNKGVLRFGEKVQYESSGKRIVLNSEPDALYDKDKDVLYFKKIETIAPIFKGIDTLYKEATQEEVDAFLGSSFVRLSDGFLPSKVGKNNRRRIAMVMKFFSDMPEEDKQQLFKYTDKYFPDLSFDGDSFSIKTDNDLKHLLYGLEEKLYTTPVTREQRAANSTIRIGQMNI